jgi:hypothetical protein
MAVLLVCVVVVVVAVVFRASKTPVTMPTMSAAINRQTRIDINTHPLVKIEPKRLKRLHEKYRTVIWN